MMSASAFVLSLDGIINTQTKQKEQRERNISYRRTCVYIRVLYKVVVRICCALLKNVLNSRNDAGLPAAGAGAGACVGLELPVAWLPGCLPVAVGTTHTHTHTQISNIIEWSVRRAGQQPCWLAIDGVSATSRLRQPFQRQRLLA